MTGKHLLDQIVRGLDGVTAGPERIWITNETDWVSFSRYGASSLEHEDCPEYVRADLSRAENAALSDGWMKAKGELAAAESRVRDLEERLAKAAEALEPFANAPEHGLHGGPMVQAVLTYEDGSDENTARHRGRISKEDFRRARTALTTIRRTNQDA